MKKLKFKINPEERHIFVDSVEFREAKLLLGAEQSNYISKLEDLFFDELNYFYLVTEYFEVLVIADYIQLDCFLFKI